MIRENTYKYSDLVIGIVFIVISFIMFIGRDTLYRDVINLLSLILFLLSIFNLLKFIACSRRIDFGNSNFLKCLFNMAICLIFCFVPKLSWGLLPLIFSLYLFAIGTSQVVMYFLFLGNNVKIRGKNLFIGICYYIISLPIMLSPVSRISDFLIYLSVYTFILGVSFVFDFLVGNFENSGMVRRLINIPKIIEAVIPYSVMRKIDSSLNKLGNICYDFGNYEDASIYFLIHTSSGGVNMFGHVDVYFEGSVYSFGNYDEGSRKYRELFGSGVLFVTKKYSEYINFCINNSKKTIFEFGVKLTNDEINDVRCRVKEILSDTYCWDYKCDDVFKKIGVSYASKLYKQTGAKFYKFNSGKYKTYFVLGSNCCYLADDIISYCNVGSLSVNGVFTPGGYYDFLNREFKREKGLVVSERIFNKYRKYK